VIRDHDSGDMIHCILILFGTIRCLFKSCYASVEIVVVETDHVNDEFNGARSTRFCRSFVGGTFVLEADKKRRNFIYCIRYRALGKTRSRSSWLTAWSQIISELEGVTRHHQACHLRDTVLHPISRSPPPHHRTWATTSASSKKACFTILSIGSVLGSRRRVRGWLLSLG
jgi:hypothetical protein